jgi:deazaflavin-dependent oxidoreductase (nitroreductase family)
MSGVRQIQTGQTTLCSDRNSAHHHFAMSLRKRLNSIGNPFVSWLLRSPAHGLLSRNVMLVSVTGRKSGKTYTTPVEYKRTGNKVAVVSRAGRTWWRNLEGGAPVRVFLRGKWHDGQADVERPDDQPDRVAIDIRLTS